MRSNMGESRRLKSATPAAAALMIFALLSVETGVGYGLVPVVKPLVRRLGGEGGCPRHVCNSPGSRADRSRPLSAIVLGRNEQSSSSSSSSPSRKDEEQESHDMNVHIDVAGSSTDGSYAPSAASQRYGLQGGHTLRHNAPVASSGFAVEPGVTGDRGGTRTTSTSASAASASSSKSKKRGKNETSTTSLDRVTTISSGSTIRTTSIGTNAAPTARATTVSPMKPDVHADNAISVDLPRTAVSSVTDRDRERRSVGPDEACNVQGMVEQGKQGALFAGDAEQAAVRAQVDEDVDVEGVEGVEEMLPLGIGGRWRKRVTFVVRTVQIWAFLFHVLIKLLRQKLVQRDEVRMSARRRKLGRYLCRAFLKLGPTFIKIGQLLSTRVDLLSTEYIEELRRLQDDVPGFGGEKAVEIIERELRAPIGELFDTFNSTSLAAASLGQVHEAWLDGQRYAVKVQRPGLKELFEVDLKSIGALAAVLDKFDPKLDGASRDWGAIFRESSRVLYEEVDYMREGENAERFSKNFKGTEWIKAPSINWSRSSSKVLCMEFLEGIKVSDVDKIEAAGVDRALLARRTAECYLAQLCRHGFFHCDPHPGNLACDAVGGGRIIFYDFGMMDELSMPLKRGLVNLIFGIYGNDVKEVVDSLEEMDVIRKGADRMTVERVTRFYLGEFQTTLTKGGKYINELDPEEERALVRRERAQIGQDLFSGGSAVPLQFPASFTFVFRAFTTLDGIGKTLDSGYDLTKIASPYLKELLDLKDGSAYVSVLKSWQKRLGWRGQDVASVVQSPRRLQHVNEVVTQLERGDLRLRVRVLESEAAFARMEATQGSLTAAVMATLLLNAGTALASRATAGPAVVGARAMYVLAGFFGLQVPVGYLKVWRLNRATKTVKGFR